MITKATITNLQLPTEAPWPRSSPTARRMRTYTKPKTTAEARPHGMAPVRRGHPAYQYMRDADGDGVVCAT